MAATTAYASLDNARLNSLYANAQLEVRQPAAPLAAGALEIHHVTPNQALYQTSYGILQNLAAYWTAPRQNQPALALAYFYLERREHAMIVRQVIPYPHGGLWGYLRQVQVVWNLTMPKFMSYASSRLLGHREDLVAALGAESVNRPSETVKGQDAFCNDGQLAKQQVFEGRHVRVLFNFKPLSALDFLIVSKNHCENFSTLDAETYAEAMAIGDAIVTHYQVRYPIAYVTHANGAPAGQTVHHWHLHVTMAASKVDELRGTLNVIGKMLGLVKPLSDQALALRIEALKTDLSAVSQLHGQHATLTAPSAKKQD